MLTALVLVLVGVCPGRSYAQEAILTDNSTVVAAKPRSVPSASSQRSLHVVGPLDSRTECDALLKFDLSTIPNGTTSTNILKATLILWADTLIHGGTFDVVSVGGAWNERTVTWATAPALLQIEAAGVVAVQGQFVRADLTELVRNWVDGTITNYGIAIVPNASGVNVSFDSKESTGTSHQPQLVIVTSQNVSLFPNDAGYVTMTVTNVAAQTNGTYSGLTAGTATFACNSSNLGNLSSSGWSNFVNSVTNGLPDATTLAGKAATNQFISLFPNDTGYVTMALTNGLPDAYTLAGKASTNLFSGCNTGLVANAGAPDLTKYLRQDGSWTTPAGATNGLAYLNDLNATNAAIRTGSQAVTNGLPDANTLAGKAATNQDVSLFPNDAGYVTITVTNAVAQTNGTYSGLSAGTATFASNAGNLGDLSTSGWSNFVNSVTNGLPDANTLAGKAATNQNVSLFPNDANYVTKTVTNGLPDAYTLAGKASTNLFSGSNTGLVANAGAPDPTKFLRQDGLWIAPAGATNGLAYLNDLLATNAAIRTGSQAVTNGLPDANTLAGKAATNQNVSLFPNDAGYVTITITNAVAQTNGTYSGMTAGTATFASDSGSLGNLPTSAWSNFVNSVTNTVAQTNGTYSGMSAGTATFATYSTVAGAVTYASVAGTATFASYAGNAGNLGGLSTASWSNFVNSVTNVVAQTNGTYSGMTAGTATFASDSGSLGNLPASGWSNFVNSVTNSLPDANTLAGKAATNLFSGSNTGLVANAGAPDPTKFLRQDGSWTAPAGATNGLAYLNDLYATNAAIRIGLQAVTNGLPTTAVTNGLETITAAGALTNGLVTGSITNGLALPSVTNGFVSATVTNGLALASVTNGLPTTAITNGLETTSAAGALASTNFVISTSNTLAAATLSVTNGLPTTAITNGLALTSVTNGLPTTAITNGLDTIILLTSTSNTLASADTSASNFNAATYLLQAGTNGFVTVSVTNGLFAAANTNQLASTNLFTGSNTGLVSSANGFVTVSITNGLYLASNPSAYVSASVTNGLPTTAITNGLVTIAVADALTNGFVGASITNGLATSLVTNGLETITAANTLSNTLATATLAITNGLVAVNQNISLFPNDAGFVTQTVTNGLPDASTLAGKAATDQNVSLFPNDANYVTKTVTNGLPDANILDGKAATNLFSGSNTGLVASAEAPDPTKFLRQDGSWIAPAGATNGLAYLNDLLATNAAIRIGLQAVTNGLPDAATLAGKAATDQNVSLFPNDAGYVTKTVTNGLPDASTLAGKAATDQNVSLFPNDAGYVTKAVTNGLPDAATLAGKAATNQNVSLFPNDAGYVTKIVTNGLETTTAASPLTNVTAALGVSFQNGNFRCFYTVSVGMISTTVVDFINLTDATTNTISVAAVGDLILTNSVFQFAGPNEVFIINTNRSGAGQAPSLIRVTGKIL